MVSLHIRIINAKAPPRSTNPNTKVAAWLESLKDASILRHIFTLSNRMRTNYNYTHRNVCILFYPEYENRCEKFKR
jgi:hypothetical protein